MTVKNTVQNTVHEVDLATWRQWYRGDESTSKVVARLAAVLDRRRLGKQRVEVLQILRTLAGESAGWKNHPAVRMWRGWEHALIDYGLAVCAEWRHRGYEDSCGRRIAQLGSQFHHQGRPPRPPWLGDELFHLSHRSNLLRKEPAWYRPAWPDDPDDLPYAWPLEAREGCER